ncbi:MAG: MBL fold metallo-hydrolase [Sciscionella sp.]
MRAIDRGLHRIADDVWAWVVPNGTWGWSNAGLVAGDGASVLFDTQFDLELTRELLDALAPITARCPITDVVNSHADGDHCYGNELLADSVRIHASSAAIPGMRALPPQAIAAMVDADLGPVLSPFLKECFGPFRLDEVTFREPRARVGSRPPRRSTSVTTRRCRTPIASSSRSTTSTVTSTTTSPRPAPSSCSVRWRRGAPSAPADPALSEVNASSFHGINLR